MRHLRLFGPAVALGLLATVAVASPSFAQQGRSITVTIGPGREEATGTGTATLTDLGNGTTRVVLNLSATNPEMLAHIHSDVCPGAGPVLYPLTNPVNGQSTTIIDAPLSEILQKGKSINTHKSPQQGGIYVGCGNLPVAAAQAAAPTQLPRTGDLGAIAPLLAAMGVGLAGVGLVLRRRFAR